MELWNYKKLGSTLKHTSIDKHLRYNTGYPGNNTNNQKMGTQKTKKSFVCTMNIINPEKKKEDKKNGKIYVRGLISRTHKELKTKTSRKQSNWNKEIWIANK